MQLSSKGRYAVMAMADLARHSQKSSINKNDSGTTPQSEERARLAKPISISSVSERQHISQTFLEQIFMHLRRGGLVASSRGPGGGYVLARPPKEISIFEIMKAVDEPVQMTRCSLDEVGGCVKGERCLTHGLWQDLSEHIAKFLSETSLADVIADKIVLRMFEVTSIEGA